MSKKQRVYVLEGQTKPLVDGQTRTITLVGVVTEEVVQDTETDYKSQGHKDKYVEVITTREVEKYSGKLSIGLSILNPIDENVKEEGIRRAQGRATKPGKALVTLNTNEKFFYDDSVQSILEFQLNRIANNPDKFIKVSPVKVPKKLVTAQKSIEQAKPLN